MTTKTITDKLLQYLNRDLKDLNNVFTIIAADNDSEITFEPYEDLNSIDNTLLVGEASKVLTSILPLMLFETQSTIDVEQNRKEANELTRAQLLNQLTLKATEEYEKAIEDQLKDSIWTFSSSKLLPTIIIVIIKRRTHQKAREDGRIRRPIPNQTKMSPRK
jgi:hypothetical protein